MKRRSSPGWTWARGFVALGIVVALATQYVLSTENPGFSGFNFFSYFTVLSNVSAVVVLLFLVFRPDRVDDSALWRGASTLYMGVTLLVYVTVLLPMDTDVGVSEPWIDWIIHGIGPLFMLIDWMLNPPQERIGAKTFLSWLIFPTIYLVYSLVRGPLADWYPYPFLDPREPSGYPAVAVSSLTVLVVMVVLGLGLRWWSNRRLGGTGTDIEPGVAV